MLIQIIFLYTHTQKYKFKNIHFHLQFTVTTYTTYTKQNNLQKYNLIKIGTFGNVENVTKFRALFQNY